MRLVIQRVQSASVSVKGCEVAAVGRGLLVLVGISRDDTPADLSYLVRKTLALRIFDDDKGQMNRSVCDIDGAILVVSQFTLYGETRRGARPSYIKAASPMEAERLYEGYVAGLRESGLDVRTGRFREEMLVALENDGPVTLLMESTGRL